MTNRLLHPRLVGPLRESPTLHPGERVRSFVLRGRKLPADMTTPEFEAAVRRIVEKVLREKGEQ